MLLCCDVLLKRVVSPRLPSSLTLGGVEGRVRRSPVGGVEHLVPVLQSHLQSHLLDQSRYKVREGHDRLVDDIEAAIKDFAQL